MWQPINSINNDVMAVSDQALACVISPFLVGDNQRFTLSPGQCVELISQKLNQLSESTDSGAVLSLLVSADSLESIANQLGKLHKALPLGPLKTAAKTYQSLANWDTEKFVLVESPVASYWQSLGLSLLDRKAELAKELTAVPAELSLATLEQRKADFENALEIPGQVVNVDGVQGRYLSLAPLSEQAQRLQSQDGLPGDNLIYSVGLGFVGDAAVIDTIKQAVGL